MRSRRKYPLEELSLREVQEEAEAFLEEFWPQRASPVDIEHIADVEAGLNIAPEVGLIRGFGVDGYLSHDLRDILVDAMLEGAGFRSRYRYALAREVAHWYLHEPLYRAAEYEGVEAFHRFQDELSARVAAAYEWQARTFADYILAPPDLLKKALLGALKHARSQGFRDLDLSQDAHRDAIGEWLGRRLEVPSEVIARRAQNDLLWNS